MTRILLARCYLRSGSPPFRVMFFNQKKFFPHAHDYAELVFVLDGQGIHRFGNRDYPVSRGDVFVIPKGVIHGYPKCENLSLANVIVNIDDIGIDPEDLRMIPGYFALFETEPELREKTDFMNRLVLSEDQLKEAEKLLREIDEEQTKRPPGYKFASRNSFCRLLLYVSRCYGSTAEKPSGDMLKFSMMTRFVENNYMKNISRDDIVGAARISAGTGTALFRKMTGQTPIGYLNNFRMERASAILRNGGTVTEASVSCGFRDSNYFSLVFKRLKGVSPSVYRENSRRKKTSSRLHPAYAKKGGCPERQPP